MLEGYYGHTPASTTPPYMVEGYYGHTPVSTTAELKNKVTQSMLTEENVTHV